MFRRELLTPLLSPPSQPACPWGLQRFSRGEDHTQQHLSGSIPAGRPSLSSEPAPAPTLGSFSAWPCLLCSAERRRRLGLVIASPRPPPSTHSFIPEEMGLIHFASQVNFRCAQRSMASQRNSWNFYFCFLGEGKDWAFLQTPQLILQICLGPSGSRPSRAHI